jgi:hypothetical protein
VVRRQRFLESSNTSLIMRKSKDCVPLDSLLVLPISGFKHREAPHRRAQSCIIASIESHVTGQVISISALKDSSFDSQSDD